MATRYWVLGSGTWDSTTTTNWSATSGGTGGASAPTSADDVVFNSLSNAIAYTVTISGGATVCSSITVAGPATGNVTFSGTTAWSVYGSFTLPSTGITWSYTGTITFASTSTGNTVTTNGTSLGATPITFNGIGGDWTLGSALTTTATTTLTSGTLATGNNTLSTGVFLSNGSNTRQISFGTGNINCTGTTTVYQTSPSTNLTYTGTPTVNVTASGSVIVTCGTVLNTSAMANFNFTGTSYTASVSNNHYVGSMNYSGTTGTIAASTFNIYRDLTIKSGTTVTAGANTITFVGTTGPYSITTNSVNIDRNFIFNGVGGTWNLGSSLNLVVSSSTAQITQTNGTLNLAGYTGTCAAYATATGTKNLTFNGGTLAVTNATTIAFNNAFPTNFTTTAGTGTGTISMTAATAKTFVGGGSTYNCTINQGGAGALTITGANTFTNITNTVQPATITFPASTTNTFSNFNLSGTAGNLITINSSTSGTRATLSKSTGTVSVNYLSIQDSAATGGASWYAGANSTNVSNNTGWIFTAPPSGYFGGGNFAAFF